MIVLICVIAIFLILAILLLCGKGAFLIAGYNTMTKEEKEKIPKRFVKVQENSYFPLFSACYLFLPPIFLIYRI